MDYDDALIIVCVDDVASREMTTSMMAVLKTTTYIQWAEHRDAIRAFWGRVRQSLEEIMGQKQRVNMTPHTVYSNTCEHDSPYGV
jgi:hypothetical protein